jgi:hypothetical protein
MFLKCGHIYFLALAIVPLMLLGSGNAQSKSGVHWTAYSKTAKGITGDIVVSPSAVTFEDGHRLHLAYIGTHQGVTLESGDPVARIFRIEYPKSDRFDTGYLCGKELRPTFLAVVERDVSDYELMMMGYASDRKIRMLILTVLTGQEAPDTHANVDRVCASFGYLRHIK